MTVPTESSRDRELSHDRLTDRFDQLMDDYDLGRRTEVLVDDFLRGDLRGKLVLDAGCGVGGLTRTLIVKGARVVALDIGPRLAAETKRRCRCSAVVASLDALAFPPNTFDVVFSTEAIEHTREPERSVLELYRVVKPGGHLALTTPNRLWQAPVRALSALGWRPYDGFENFLWPVRLRRVLERAGGQIAGHRGVHLWPFQVRPLRPASRWVDRFGSMLLPLMINQCIHARKPIS